MNRYLRYESAGDMYVGRCASGRPRSDKGFALSCPYFDYSDLSGAEKVSAVKELDDWIKARMPPGGHDDAVFALFRFCLASFVYHKNSGWLEENTHSQDAIRVSPF